MYESGYNKLAWGMMFIIFNINLGPINILPNFIGYLLILSGFTILSEQHVIFGKGKTASGVLALITVKDIVNFGTFNLLQGSLPSGNLWLFALGAIEQLLNLYVIYIMCKGIYMVAEERGHEDMMNSTRARFRFYLFIETVILFFTPFLLNLSNDKRMLMLAFALVGVISALFIMGLCRMARSKLGEGKGEGADNQL